LKLEKYSVTTGSVKIEMYDWPLQKPNHQLGQYPSRKLLQDQGTRINAYLKKLYEQSIKENVSYKSE